MKKILPLLMLCMFCLNFAKAQTETEPNNVWDQSNLITVGATGSGTAAVGFDEDWWRVAIPGDGKLTVDWTSTGGMPLYCQIYDTLGTILLISNYTSGTRSESFDGLGKGTYYLRFICYYTTDTGPYTFTPSFTAAPVANDAEPDSTVATAITLPLNGSVTGHTGYYFNNHRDSLDFYKITVVQDGLLSFTLTSENGKNVYAQLFDGDGTTYFVGNYTSSTATYSKDGLAPGVYYIVVHTYYNTEFAPYTLSNTFTPPANANDPIANETPATASTLPLGGSVTGHIGYHYIATRDDVDWWKVNVNADGRIDYTITSGNGQNVYAQLYDGDGTTYLAGNYTSSSANYSKDGLAPGIYYIKVMTYYTTEWDSYTLSNTLVQPTQANDIGSNDIYTNGNVFPLNSTTTGHIGYRYNGNIDAVDWYKITTTEDGKISFTITSENNQNVYAQLFDGDGTSYLVGNYTSSTASYFKDGLAAGTYYLLVHTFYTTEWAPYTLSNTFTTISSPSDQEPNNTRATASPLAINTSITGHTGYHYNGVRDDLDYFAITLPVDGKISFTISSANSQNVYAQLFDNDGTTYIVGNYTSSTATYGANNLAAGTYYMLVHTFYTTEFAPYTLSVSLEPMTFLAEAAGDNSIAARGTLLPANTPTGGHIYFYYNLLTDNTDWWKIGYDGNGTMNLGINIEQNHFNTDYPYINYALYLDTLLAPVASGQLHAATNTIPVTGLSIAKYYLKITSAFASFGAYQLTASYTERCANVVAINSSTQLAGCNGTITYGITGGLPEYTVQLYKDGSASGSALVVDNTNAITFTNLGVGTYYLRSYSFGGSGSCNNVSGNTVFAIPPTPTISTGGGATTFCQGGSVTLTSTAASSYLWSTGATTQSIVVSTSGNYSVTAYNTAGCASLVSATTVVTVNPLPATPTISTGGGATTFCEGGSVTLTSSAATSYLWSTGATTQAITVNSSGIYSVTVKNANNCSATSATTTVTVNPLPATPTISTGGGATAFCAGGSVTLTSSAATSYLWSTGATTQAIIVNASGNYSVTVKNANNCSATSTVTVVTVNPLPTVTLAAFTTVCSTDAAFTLTGGSPAGGTYSGTGVSAGQFNPATAGVGAFTITYSYTNANNCTATATQSITVNNCGGCTPTISADKPTTFCEGSNVTLTSSAASSYSWSTGATTQSITVNSSGTYTVTTINANNCTATSSPVVVTVNPLPATPTISAGGATIFCAGGAVTLTSSAATSYLWNNGETTQAISVTTSGSYSVTVKNANNCSAASVATTVTVNPLPATPTISTGGGATTFCAGGSVTLTSSSATNNSWSTGATTQSINVTSGGSYTVTVTNANNCSATSAATTVTVNPLPTVTLAAFTAVCSTDVAFTLTGGSPSGGTYSGTGVSGGQFNPATAGIGTFTITYSYSNANNCTAAATQTITVNNCGGCTPVISTGGAATTFCQGGSVTLTAPAGGTNYLWSNNATTQSITVTASGNYSVTVTNANNCTATSAVTVVTVNPLPATPTISAGSATTFCAGGSVTLTSSSATNNHWSTGATTQSIVVNASGDYTVTVTNANNCSSTSLQTSVKVNSLPATPTISASGPTTFCLGGSVTLTSSSATNNLWSNGATTQSITVSASGSYTVTVTNANNCSSSSAATVVTVNNCNGTYCSVNGTSKNKGYIANVFLRTIFNTTGWSAGGYGDYTSQSTHLNKRFDYVMSVTPGYSSFLAAAPLYTRVWIDWNQDGDFNDPGELVFAPSGASFFLRLGIINVPNNALNGPTRMRVAMRADAIPTNCGSFAYGEVEDYTVVVGNGNWYRTEEPINEPAITLSESFNVYPNPVSEEMVIQKLSNDNSKVVAVSTGMQIMDMNGRIVISSNLTRSTEVIDVRKLPAGVYFVRLRTGKDITVKKIIIAH
ncbi:MAG: GEVED domain-containing protein [Ferruginibacter sp.]